MKFKETYIEEIEHSELDLEYPFYTVDENDEDVRSEIEYDNKVDWSESPSIEIDEVIKTLETLKSKGANRCYIIAHSDHYGYVFTGVKLEKI